MDESTGQACIRIAANAGICEHAFPDRSALAIRRLDGHATAGRPFVCAVPPETVYRLHLISED